MSGQTELLPCPFCGGKADFERVGTRRASCIIVCEDCGCRLETGEEGNRCGSAWNSRQSQAVGVENHKDLAYVVKQIFADMPLKRDWLNPDIERMAREAISAFDQLSVIPNDSGKEGGGE